MKKVFATLAILCALSTAPAMAQQLTPAAAPVTTQSTTQPIKHQKPTAGYDVNSKMTVEQRADIRINRIEQRTGTLTADQKTNMKAIIVAEFDALAKTTPTPNEKNPYGIIRKNTEAQIRALLIDEQLKKYNESVVRSNKPRTTQPTTH